MGSGRSCIVVGSGPNGLAAAITLARAGCQVTVLEAEDTIGGGTRSAELTLPGFAHDVCSAIHPLGVASPFFLALPLGDFGLEWIQPPAPLAHPLDDGTAVVLHPSVDDTGSGLGGDGAAYRKLMSPLVAASDTLLDALLAPIFPPRHPLAVARFGWHAMRSARGLAESRFRGERARALFAGIAAHSVISLDAPFSASFGLVLGMLAHASGWPFPRGGSQAIAGAMAAYLSSLGGEIVTSSRVTSPSDLRGASTVLFDVSPRQLVEIGGDRLPSGYRRQLSRYRYGPAAFKLDWALDGPIPWRASDCAQAATVHLGGTFDEIAESERAATHGEHAERPFVLLAQPSLFDPTRAPAGKHTAWAYCHVPNGSTTDMTERIERQVERFAPGFRARILARHVMSPAELERHNANYVGGDVVGGSNDAWQLFARPVPRLNPYATPVKGWYLCSASTPPGGGVHGMAGFHAARGTARWVVNVAGFLAGERGADYWRTRWLLQRTLAGIYLVAFLVAVNQFGPLLGAHGLTPVPFFLQHVDFWTAPSLFFLHYSDGFAAACAWIGVVCAVFAMIGVSECFGTPVSVVIWGLMWLLYLSFVNVGQTWYGFGWETLLLECGFLAMFLGARTVTPPIVVIWLFRWVLFRLMLGAGLIKLRGDPCWRDLTCLVYHYQSQPLPNPLSWYFNRLPVAVDKIGVLFNHLVEVVAPFGLLVPLRWVRHTAGLATILLQAMLILSGNFSWLNWLTLVIAISCFDDRALARLLPIRAGELAPLARPHRVAVTVLAVLVGALSIQPVVNILSPGQLMNASFEPLHLVNTYGAFGSISRRRMEVVLEGTSDSVITPATQWKEYEFKAKPGDVARRPPLVAPYHLRLDWLMWFAGLSRDYADPWLLPLVARLLQNDNPTLGLIGANPFPDRAPVFIRARLYEYRFTTAEERRQTGDWWSRALADEYLPPISLHEPGLLDVLRAQGWVY